MGTREPRARIWALLESIKADFPRRKKAAEEFMKQHGLDETLTQRIKPAEKVTVLPTFSPKVFRPVTPMLRARFDYAGSWNAGGNVWLGATEMPRWMRKRSLLSSHRAMREHWEGSAPMRYPDDRLTLFGTTDDLPENLTYLVWTRDDREPEVWRYYGWSEERFANLEKYLYWHRHRE